MTFSSGQVPLAQKLCLVTTSCARHLLPGGSIVRVGSTLVEEKSTVSKGFLGCVINNLNKAEMLQTFLSIMQSISQGLM